ncbi:MAG: methyl-accepting chemotaxis protein [Pseudomonadota bacterium]
MLNRFFSLFSRDNDDPTEPKEENSVLADSDAAFMMIDRDFNITWVNQATTDLLVNNEAEFRKIWPDFDPHQMVGSCIDRFHKNPAHQRSMMSHVINEPFYTNINVGPLTIALKVTSTVDSSGAYIGNTLEWRDLTDELEREARAADSRGQIQALNKLQAIIEFSLDATVIRANENFCELMGYSSDEIVGKKHELFVEPEMVQSGEHAQHWEQLRAGTSIARDCLRVAKSGKSVWLRATYVPIVDKSGTVLKVIKYASDITDEKRLQAEIEEILSETTRVMRAVSKGDLTVRVAGTYSAEFAKLQSTVNETLVDLSQTVAEINQVSNSVDSGAAEISQANINLSQRTEEQSASLKMTSSSMDEMTATVKDNAESAKQANLLAIKAQQQAEEGGGVVEDAIAAMHQINESSQKIADIISVIDEIAFQTNLLALNASVEAARAGDQGRGFAVVASEVRSLAGRSATAAKEIKNLIDDSAVKVDEGSRLVNQSGETLSGIVDGVKKVTDIVGEIAEATEKQATGIDRINFSVTQMDELTQQNAGLVEEAAAASQTLSEQSEGLAGLVGRFVVDLQKSPSKSAALTLERRSSTRPWSDSAKRTGNGDTSASASPIPAPPASDAVWNEF